MSKVRVYQASDANSVIADPVCGKVGEALDAIRRRAFELFETRGRTPGGELDDWLQAERDLYFAPHAEVHEGERGFRVMVSAPGFDAGDIDVFASPRELLVEAKIERRLEPMRDNMRAGGLETRILHRRFELGTPIEADKVTARLDEGSLMIEAPKKVYRFPARAAAA